jgi:L-fuculose-phosphate aldolase
LQRTDIRAEIVRVGQLMHQKGFIVASDGNISVRLGADRVLATPSGRHKGFLRPDELITTDMDGRPINPPPGLEPTSEMPMHLEIYRQRPQVAAVVHAHLPLAVALSIAGIRLDEPFLPEAVITLGPIPTTEYAIPSSLENVTAIRDLIGQHDAIVLRRHGAITVGSDPFDAYMRMEAVEHKAHIVLLLRLLGQGEPLSSGQVASLLELRRRLGLGPAT